MSRPTDTERGARIAQRIASERFTAHHSPLFPLVMDRDEIRFWNGIETAIAAQLRECEVCREAMRA